ncbi:MAG: hypothetical protein FH748_07875 [Balneolaceae bacterium]|nr:hypothetical protein [Balneolaceae bacterium]
MHTPKSTHWILRYILFPCNGHSEGTPDEASYDLLPYSISASNFKKTIAHASEERMGYHLPGEGSLSVVSVPLIASGAY